MVHQHFLRTTISDVEVSLRYARRARQMTAIFTRDELKTELTVFFDAAHPILPPSVECPEVVPGVPKQRHRNWLLAARHALESAKGGDGALLRTVQLWARNLQGFFEGVEECPICYSICHISTRAIPRKPCPTCKHKFHSECLYKWFRTSNKTTCPLCNQPM